MQQRLPLDSFPARNTVVDQVRGEGFSPEHALALAAVAHHIAGMAKANDMSESAERLRAKRCPICGKPSAPEFRPFCSRRCADVDLHRWLGGVYAIPVKDEEDEDGAPKREPDA
jgi:endogenous inhibitor of DNA gyrase (YacG/DUF329 family)